MHITIIIFTKFHQEYSSWLHSYFKRESSSQAVYIFKPPTVVEWPWSFNFWGKFPLMDCNLWQKNIFDTPVIEPQCSACGQPRTTNCVNKICVTLRQCPTTYSIPSSHATTSTVGGLWKFLHELTLLIHNAQYSDNFYCCSFMWQFNTTDTKALHGTCFWTLSIQFPLWKLVSLRPILISSYLLLFFMRFPPKFCAQSSYYLYVCMEVIRRLAAVS